MNRFFAKDLPESPVFVMGHPMTFDFLETSDPTLIAELENCIRRSVGGVSEISAETYAEEIKKKERERLSGNNSKPQFRRTELSFIGSPGAAAHGSSFTRRQQPEVNHAPSVNGQPMPDPIEVPAASSFTLPPTAKMKDLKASKAKEAAK